MTSESIRQTGSTQSERWLRLARALTLILILASTTFFLYDLVLLFQAESISLEDIRPDPSWKDDELLIGIDELGLSLSATYIVVGIPLMIASISMIAVGLVIFFRKQKDWFGLYLGAAFVLTGTLGNPDLSPIIATWPMLEPALNLIVPLIWSAFFPLLTLFPDGRFVPRWTKWALIVWAICQVPMYLLPDIALLISLFYILLGVASQVYRYRRVSRAVEQQQTRWVMIAFGFVGLSIIWIVLTVIISGDELAHNSHTLVLMLLQVYLLNLSLAALPITIAIAILRYRLWDLGVVVNRALIYGPLMTILAAIFAASVALTTELSKQLIPDSPGVPAVLSAILVASVFQPVRSRVEAWVNKRFYVKKRDLVDGLVEIQPSFWPFRSAEEIMQASTQHVCQIMGCKAAAIFLPLDALGFWIVQAHGLSPEELPVVSLSPEQRKTLERKRVAESNPGDSLKGYVPLYIEKPDAVHLIGLMGIGAHADGRGYSGDDLKELVKLGSHIGLALHALRPMVQDHMGNHLEEITERPNPPKLVGVQEDGHEGT